MSAPSVLIVEDEANLRELIRDLLTADGLEVHTSACVADARAALESHVPDLLLLDVRLPDGDGLSLLDELRGRGVVAPAIVMTAFGTIDRAVQALRSGAADFLVKPFDNDRLSSAVATAIETARQLEDVELRAGTVGDDSDVARELVGSGGGLRDVVALLPRVAASEATVMIRGESGTGKELIARAVHAASPRMDGPFVSLNCAAIPPTLLESELFGFERGAFTGAHARRKGHIETADGGTLFLDEIGDMALDAQARLLRVLQEREITRVGGRDPVKVDVRIIAATHRDLNAMVAEHTFRQDLMYRLNVVPIELPPLRARKQDIRGLVLHFLERHRRAKPQLGLPKVTDALFEALARYDWPGNVRELENVVERAMVLGVFDTGWIDAAAPKASEPPPPDDDGPVRTLKEVVGEAERAAVVKAIRAAGGNKAQAARLLGVSYKTLFNKINEHGIKVAKTIS